MDQRSNTQIFKRKQKVAILVYNYCIYDSRVIKTAEAMYERGFDVVVFARNNGKQRHETKINGVRYVREKVSTVPLLNFRQATIFDQDQKLGLIARIVDWMLEQTSFAIVSSFFIYKVVARRGSLNKQRFAKFFQKIPDFKSLETLLFRVKAQKAERYSKVLVSSVKESKSAETPKSITKKMKRKVIRFLLSRKMVSRAISETHDAAVRNLFHDSVSAYDPDLLHVNDFIPLKLGVELGQKLNIPVIYDVHEFESGRQDSSHVMTNEQILKAEIELSAHISGSFTVSRRLADYYSEFCGFSPSVVCNTPRLKPTFDDYGWKYVNIRTAIGAGADDVVAVYTGLAVKGRGLEKLISSISKFSSLYLVCVGPVTKSNLTYFSNLADQAGCHERLHFHEAVHFDLVSKYISMADFGVIPAIGNLPNQRAGLPNKLFEMIFAGLPVLLADIEQRRVIVEQFGAGIFFPNDNDVVLNQYIEEMLDLLSAPETKQVCQRRALSAYELIGWHKQMDIVEQTYLDRLSN